MKNKTRKLVLAAIMAALVFVSTYFVHIPIPGSESGYLNIGDIIVYLAAVIPGGWYGIFASAVGSALADVVSGAVIYVPATFVIKGLMTFVTSVFILKHKKTAGFIIGSVLSGLIMLSGYFVYELIVFGFSYAVISVPYNLIQYVFGVTVSIVLFVFLRRTPLSRFTSIDIKEKK